MENALVSILIPAYNVEKYIQRTVRSCLEQTYPNIEVVVVNDGSEDSTGTVLDSCFGNIDNVLIRHKENRGVSSARNTALAHASGQYIMFLDGDDWLEPDAVETMMELKKRYPRSLIASTLYSVSTSPKDNRETRVSYQLGIKPSYNTIKMEDALASFSIYRLQSACYKIFDLELIKTFTINFDESISHGEDGLFVYDYLKKCDTVVYVDKPLWNILRRRDSATAAPYNPYFLTAIDAVDRMIDHPDNSWTEKQAMYQYGVFRTEGLMTVILRNGVLKNRRDIQRLRRKLRDMYDSLEKKTTQQRIKFFIYEYTPLLLLKMGLVASGNIKRTINKRMQNR